ncbi:MAG: SUMF1/EgtB/PvdO family nonheme iron enzyme [Rubrivivax sp.]|jgi:ergothioneine biosynthesis protein EgtB|nr:ergothioneine biosynthesis protein EgtB [Betaproteobacteria bacterium]MBP6317643.1 SUMF1/EgtB/PvdO family nonheme iron enzyme [Rubrivivax sp.]MBK7517215.1 ergothioneine biosynthesis protein EgtB [Betaproteobacteria bacterium]MBK9683212.1 ergothioneine biosynthesis protein EgtB [Betaproteobacteria bacterium]MBL0296398.1 ergothioneine biosynthesis protein EgtB [Betaproteobacteria bacterium]
MSPDTRIHSEAGPRYLDREALARALPASRADTLTTFALFEQVLPQLVVPQRAELNPPLWELGHIGWFQEWWLARNPQRLLGAAADPLVARTLGVRAGADALYNSSAVPHDSRWALPLPDAAATRADLAAQLSRTLELLADAPQGDDALYFYRWSLFHEDMHHEAAVYMAQGLGVPITDPRWQPAPLPPPAGDLALAGGPHRLGHAGAGFAFDNELAAHDTHLAPFRIDQQARRWAAFLPFVEAGGYAEPRWWTAAGRAWLAQTQAAAPRYLRRSGRAWQQWRHGRWTDLDPALPACHLTQHEALAWCAWAGRRLPTEAEWEAAALQRPEAFRWGDVWEWTASTFAPYPGFRPHPYRDYSAPWFDGRPVLRGASFATQPRMRWPRYRNYFPAERNDIFAGLRSCAP